VIDGFCFHELHKSTAIFLLCSRQREAYPSLGVTIVTPVWFLIVWGVLASGANEPFRRVGQFADEESCLLAAQGMAGLSMKAEAACIKGFTQYDAKKPYTDGKQ
jgi:hypothetical protein